MHTLSHFNAASENFAPQSLIDYFLDQLRSLTGRGANFVCSLDARHRRRATRWVVTKNNADGITGARLIANFHLRNEPDARIDFVFDAHAAAAGFGDGMTNFRRVNFRDEPGARRFYLKRFRCQRQNLFRFVAHARIAALRGMSAADFARTTTANAERFFGLPKESI